MFTFVSFITFGKFRAINFSNILSAPLSPLSSFWDSYNVYFNPLDGVLQVPYALFTLSMSYLQVFWFFLLPAEICLWNPLVNLSFQLLLLFLAPDFFLLPFKVFSLFIDISILFIHYFLHFLCVFSSLSIFKIVVLKSLSSRFNTRSFSDSELDIWI